ncbi:MAG: peptide ligase PGM1-related protein, partial [Gemmatimonadota bacterium]
PFAVVAPGTRPDRAFDDALARVGERLYEPGSRSGIVFLTPGGGATHPGISFLAIAGTVDEARRMASEASELLRPDGER